MTWRWTCSPPASAGSTSTAWLDETNANMQPRRATARLWPQTERLKAALLGHEPEARAAAHALHQYLQTPVSGLWRTTRRRTAA